MVKRPVEEDQITGIECKHATYVRANDGSYDDLLAIKEVIHTKDGRKIPFLYPLKNFERSFYITNGHYRNHKQKKDWEELSRLQRFTSKQIDLTRNIARALNSPMQRSSLKQLARSPFLYGADISTPAIIKHHYQKKYNNIFSENSVAVLDIETDMIAGDESPILVGITFKDKAFLAATRDFVKQEPNFIADVHATFDEVLGDIKRERNITLEVKIARSPGEACAMAIAKAHEWKPDFLTIWNIDFDIPRIIAALKKDRYNPADVFSDPSIPPRFRYAHYKEGARSKTSAAGVRHNLDISEQWHSLITPASFYVIDSMCVYRFIRLAKQKEPSYSLDAQLNKHLGMRKLKFDGLVTEQSGTAEWHVAMQKNHKVPYAVYNLFDCIGVELFDEKVKDLAQTISVHAGFSEYRIFNSQPKRLVDRLHFYYLERGKVMASCSDTMHDAEIDDHTMARTGWIITLPSHLLCENGLPVVKDIPTLPTLVYAHVADLDVSAAYPNAQVVLNISKETTHCEVSKVKGLTLDQLRFAAVDLTASHVNAYELCRTLYKAPSFDSLLEDFQSQIEAT